MPPPRNMPSAVNTAFAIALILFFPTVAVSGQSADRNSGAVLDVMMFDATCLNQTECELVRPTHLVEYFAADWCEPCYEVSPLVNNLTVSDALVLQHPSSPVDQAYMSLSNQRFEQDYRLVFYPSIVVDGSALLTGARQALDLTTVIENSTTAWGGLESLSTENGTLLVNDSDLGDHQLTMWVTQPMRNSAGNMTHAHLVTTALVLNTSEGSIDLANLSLPSQSTVVLVLESIGPKRLTVASLAPTGEMEIVGAEEEDRTAVVNRAPWALPALVGGALLFAIAPAMLMHRRLMRLEPQYESE